MKSCLLHPALSEVQGIWEQVWENAIAPCIWGMAFPLAAIFM